MSRFISGVGVGMIMASIAIFASKPPAIINIDKVVHGGVQTTELAYSQFKPLPKLNIAKEDSHSYIHSSVRRVQLASGESGIRIVVLFKPEAFFV